MEDRLFKKDSLNQFWDIEAGLLSYACTMYCTACWSGHNREFQTYIFFQCGKSEIGIGSFTTAQIPRTQFEPLGRGPGFDVKYIRITTKIDT